jgi:Domain of unknown function (DUF4129)
MNAGRAPIPAAGVHNPWVMNVLRPLGLTIMAACVALPMAQVIVSVAPGLHVWFLIAACVLTALEISYTHRIIRAQFGVDIWRLRAIEAGIYFVVLKAASVAIYGLPAGAVGDWLLNVRWWLDGETLIALGLAVAFALAVDGALQDFDRVGEAAEPSRDYVSSVDSLTGQFFTGGAVLMIFAGLARVNLITILNTERPPVTGLLANVLIYFLVGLLLISQVRLELLAVRWQAQGVRTPLNLTQRWVRYTLTFVGLSTLVAFVLPTGYTLGTLGVLGGILSYVFGVLWIAVFLLISLMLLPLTWLASLLRGNAVPPTLPAQPPPPPPPNITTLAQHPLPPWLDTARDIFVILVIIALVAYLLWNYLRDRPELYGSLKALAPLRALRRLWAVLRHRVSGLLASAREAAPVVWLRDRLRRAAPANPWGYFRLGAASPREQVLFYYLSLLRRAGQQGFGRRPPQSPRDYEPVLKENLPDTAPELQGLTAAFEETRYSAHPVSPEQAKETRALWQRIRAALNGKKRDA